MYLYTYIYTSYMCIYISIDACRYMCIYISIDACRYKGMCIFMYIHIIYVEKCQCSHALIWIYTHTHTYTHILTPMLISLQRTHTYISLVLTQSTHCTGLFVYIYMHVYLFVYIFHIFMYIYEYAIRHTQHCFIFSSMIQCNWI